MRACITSSHRALTPSQCWSASPHGLLQCLVVARDQLRVTTGACRCSRIPKAPDRAGDKGAEQQGLSEHDKQLGNALTLVQLGHWPEAASSFAQLNRFYAEMYQQAAVSTQLQGTPPQHNSGKAQLNIEEWISCMKQLNRCGPHLLCAGGHSPAWPHSGSLCLATGRTPATPHHRPASGAAVSASPLLAAFLSTSCC